MGTGAYWSPGCLKGWQSPKKHKLLNMNPAKRVQQLGNKNSGIFLAPSAGCRQFEACQKQGGWVSKTKTCFFPMKCVVHITCSLKKVVHNAKKHKKLLSMADSSFIYIY